MTKLERSKAEFRSFLIGSALCPMFKEHLETCDYCLGSMVVLFEINRIKSYIMGEK